jgi:SH3 domain-containing YSC84-like protein 1
MRRIAALIALIATAASIAWAVDVAKELDSAAEVIENMTSSHQIPSSFLRDAKCIAVIPNLTKAGLIVGGEHGNGVVSCRTSTGWSAPAFITMRGGSIGLQAGGEHQDIVLLMNRQGEQELRTGHWDLGAEATAAGPTASAGRAASTGWKAPVLSYTHSSGAYAGANLEGSKINVDQDTIHNLYGENASLQTILDGQVQPPASDGRFLAALRRVAGK